MLKMVNPNDKVLIKGSFLNRSFADFSGLLTEGTLEIKGDFYQSSGATTNFRASGNHKVLFSGDGKQTVKFDNSWSDKSYFNNLEIQNESEEGVVFDTTSSYPLAIGKVKDNGNKVTGALSIIGSTSFEDNHYCSDLVVVENITLSRDKEIETDGNFTVNNYSLYLYGKLTVGGTLSLQSRYTYSYANVNVKGNMEIGGQQDNYMYFYLYEGSINVDGDLSISRKQTWIETRLYQTNANSDVSITVKGNMSVADGCYYIASWGAFTLGGNLSGNGYLQLSGSHKTFLNGTDLQIIELNEGSYFANLEISNYSKAGVSFNRMIKYDTFVRNGCRVSFGENSYELGWTLTENEVYDANLYLWDDTLDLNGKTLTVNGDLIAMGGKIDFNGGKLIVNGDLRVQTIDSENEGNISYGAGSCKFDMNNSEDYLLINGNFYYYPKTSSNDFSDGTIEIKGNFEQIGGNIYFGKGNNTVKFTGNTKQTITESNNSQFANFINENSEELEMKSSFTVTGIFTDETENINGSGTVIVSNPSQIKNGICSGNLQVTGGSNLQEDLSVEGTLTVNDKMYGNGKNISAGNLVLNAALYVDKAQITVSNNINVERYGYLIMVNDDDYVLANGNFTFNSYNDHSTYLTAGVLELRGDFTQNNARNFIASGTHTTIFSRKKSTTGREYVQTINFTNSAGTTRFNKIVLKKKEKEYHFVQPISSISNSVEYAIEDDEAPSAVAFIIETQITEKSVSFSFGGAEDNNGILGYEIYRDGKLLGVTSNTSYVDNSVDSDMQYTYTVFAFDNERNKATSSPALNIRTKKDSEAPSTPQNLGLKSRTGSSISIEWSPSTDNVKVVGYNVYANGELLAENVKETTFKATDLEKTQVYKFTVEAVDKAGNTSERSAVLEAEVKMPKILSVTPDDNKGIGGDSIVLSVYYENVGNSTGNKVAVQIRNAEGEWETIVNRLSQKVASYGRLYSTYTWDISDLTGEDSYEIRYVLTDADGNEDTKEVTYIIDKVGPEVPENFRAIADNGNVNIIFDASVSADCAGYEIHRATYGEDKIICNLSGRYNTVYTDKDVNIGSTYEYYVIAYDSFGNKSKLSDGVVVLIEKDEFAPEIKEFYPRAGRVNSDVKIEITAQDNKSVDSIGIQYKALDAEEWIDVEEKNAVNGKATFTFDTTTLTDGEYYFNAYAIDGSGNKSVEDFTRRYTVDNTGIAKIVITNVSAASSYVKLEWEDAVEDDFGYFAVEQLVDGEYVRIKKITDTLGVYVDNLKPDTEYSFRVVGYDNLDNRGIESDIVKAETVSDTTAPIINAIYPAISRYNNVLELGVEATDDNMLGYAVFSYSTDNIIFNEIGKVNADSNVTHAKLTQNFDISEIREGSLFIKFEVYDICGNKNAPLSDGKDIIAEYTVDRTVPDKIQGLKCDKYEGGVEIEWNQPDQETNSDIDHFIVHRADNSNGIYKVVGEKVKSINFFDANVKVGDTYLYKVSAVDVAGNEGDCSDEIIVTVIKDNEAPIVHGISPKSGNRLKADPTFTVVCTDNSGVSKVRLEYSKENESQIWTKIGETSASGNYTSSNISWDTDKIEEGNYSVKAIAVDNYGNESEAYLASYVLDKTAPVINSVQAETRNFAINVSVALAETNDFSQVEYLRREVGGEFETIAKTDELSYLDENVIPKQNYIYQVKAYDTAGNCAVSEEVYGYADDTDDVNPVAILAENYTGIAGMEMEFDGLESYDNVRITEYKWDMGNGDVRYGATIKYKYNTPGQYMVVLTVKDSSGNTGSTSAIVKVYERNYKGLAKVQVTDENGKGLPYASVYIKVGSDKGITLKADRFGYVDVVADAGKVTIAAYKTEYLPKEETITVSEFETLKYKLALVKDDLVVGNLTVTRMTLEEMVEAGVDFSNPKNYCSYRFEFTVTFEKKPIPVQIIYLEEGDEFGDGCTFYIMKDADEICSNLMIEPIIVHNDEDDEVVPIVSYMSTKSGISWLKDMFNVELGVMNQADRKFVINNCYAVLNLPNGLSLANLKEKQSLKNDMGSIRGQESKQTSWIVRGDKRGEYNISADFKGILMPFNEAVSFHFDANTSIDVNLGEGIVIDVYPEDKAYAGEYYYVHFAITNTSEYPKYDFSTTIGRFDMPNQEISYTNVETGETTEYVSDIVMSDPSNVGTGVVVSGGRRFKFKVLEPGQTYFGTYKMYMYNGIFDKEEYYYNLIEMVFKDTSLEDYGVEVRIHPINSHLQKNRYKFEYIEKLEGDPIDLATGFYTDEAYPITVKGNAELSFEMNYNSGSTSDRGEMGYGWYNPYEIKLEDKGGFIWFYSNPGGVVSFIDDDVLEGNYMGKNVDDEVYLVGDRKYTYGKYTCINGEMRDCYLTKEDDDTYVIQFANGTRYIFDSLGRLSQMINPKGQKLLFGYADVETIITEEISQKSLTVIHNEKGLVSEVSDSYGRSSYYVYDDFDNLISIVYPDGNTTSYKYDENHRIIEGSNSQQGIYITNVYDEKGRVTQQKDAFGNAIDMSYTLLEDGKTVIDVQEPNGLEKVIEVDPEGKIVSEKQNGKLYDSYIYESDGTIKESDYYGNTSIWQADSKGNIIKTVNAAGEETVISYDSFGNPVYMTDSSGRVVKMEYNSNNCIISQEDNRGADKKYYYNDNAQLTEEYTEGKGSTYYTYNNGLVESVTDYNGNKTLLYYDDFGNNTQITDAQGNNTYFTYNVNGKVTSQTDALGNTSYYSYDMNGNVKSEKDSNGNTIKYEYDNKGQLIKALYPDGSNIKYEYDSVGNCVKTVLNDERTIINKYDLMNNLTEMYLDGETVHLYRYDGLTRCIEGEDENGLITKCEYYTDGNVKKISYASGEYEEYLYNSKGLLTQVTESGVVKNSYTYDAKGNLISEKDACGNTTAYTYDDFGQLTGKTDARGYTEKYGYDNNGNCTYFKDALGKEIHMVYDSLNRMTEAYMIADSGEKYSVKYSYDALGRVVSKTDEEGNTVYTQYDKTGNVTSVKDSEGNIISSSSYDLMGRLSSEIDSYGVETTYQYDKYGEVITEIQQLSANDSRVTEYEYDNFGRVLNVKKENLVSTSIVYDAAGNISQLIDPNGGTSKYSYDSMNRVVKEVSAIGSVKNYEYNSQGLLEKQTNSRGQNTTYSYDSMGRLSSFTDELGTVSYSYDANGNVTSVTDKNGTIYRTFDALNRVTSYTDYKNNVIKYSYDELGNLISLTYPGGEVVRYEYYKNGWLKNVIDNNGRVTNYTYDSSGRILTCLRANNTKEIYTYSSTGLLEEKKDVRVDASGLEYATLLDYHFSYDASGNVTEIEGYDSSNLSSGTAQLKSDSFEYDDANRLIKFNDEAIEYDADGNMIYGPVNGQMTTLSYDCRNRLISAGDERYTYDAENIRTSLISGDGKTEFITDTSEELSRVLVESKYVRTGADSYNKVSERQFVYGNGLVYEIEGSKEFHHHYNHLGSTMVISDRDGQTVAKYSYGLYGELLSGDSSISKYLYNGKDGVRTESNGLYYMRQRYYNPEIKRFINQDILIGSIENPLSLNRYSYVQGNPANYTDPFGLCPSKEALKAKFTSLCLHAEFLGLGTVPGLGLFMSTVDCVVSGAEGDLTGVGLGLASTGLGVLSFVPGVGWIAAPLLVGVTTISLMAWMVEYAKWMKEYNLYMKYFIREAVYDKYVFDQDVFDQTNELINNLTALSNIMTILSAGSAYNAADTSIAEKDIYVRINTRKRTRVNLNAKQASVSASDMLGMMADVFNGLSFGSDK